MSKLSSIKISSIEEEIQQTDKWAYCSINPATDWRHFVHWIVYLIITQKCICPYPWKFQKLLYRFVIKITNHFLFFPSPWKMLMKMLTIEWSNIFSSSAKDDNKFLSDLFVSICTNKRDIIHRLAKQNTAKEDQCMCIEWNTLKIAEATQRRVLISHSHASTNIYKVSTKSG